jgi:DNA-binding transcriptional ArsR family regulator
VAGYTSVSDRTVRKHTSRLEDAELIERMTDGTAACFNFASFEAEALVSHVLTCYYTDSEDDAQ